MGANGNINDLELAKFIELAGEYGIRVHILHGDNWNPAVANMAALPPTGNTIGDIRQALDTGIPYRWNGSAWSVWSTAGASWGGISGTLSAQTDLQAALDAKMGAGAYVLVSRDSLLANQINLGAMTSGILKQTVSAGIATITILTDNSTNWNAAYTHTSNTSNPHSVTKSQVGLGNVDNTSDANKPVSTAQQTALDLKAPLASPTFTGTVTVPTPSGGTDAVTKAYADALVAGLLDYRGGYDASINLFPSTGGSGIAGAVVKGDMWIISVAGTLGGTAVQIGDSIIVNVDTPGQTAGNWNILDSNISYVPEDVANKATTMTGNTASNTIYLSAKAIYDWVTTLLLASLTPKTTPVDADGFAIMDSAASNVMKFLSFTNLKAFLKTYFDTLYPSGSGTSSGTNTGDNATNTTSNTYADGKVADAINNGTTTIAPSQNAVFDALALKAPLISPSFTTPALGTPASGVLTNCTGGATTAEINTGTANKPMPIDQFVASTRNVRFFDIYAIEKTTDNAVGTNIIGSIECPFTGTITEIGAYVETAGVTGASVWDVNKNGTTIMTTNKLSIDSAEVSTRTATTAPTLTTTAITAGDLITIDTDSLSTTKPKGLHVRIGIRLS